MTTQQHLIDLGFVPFQFKKTIAFSINNRCQGVLNNGVFFFKLKEDGEYLQAKNKNHLKWLFKKEHRYAILDLEIMEAVHRATTKEDDSSRVV